MNVNHKFTEDMAASRQEYVLAKQKEIRLGGRKTWVDVEGDEASFAKTDISNIDDFADPQKPALWEQWCGLIERGRPESLILEHLKPRTTEKRAPGPSPIRKIKWQLLGKTTSSSVRILQAATRHGSRGQARQRRSLQRKGEGGEREMEVADAQLCQGDDPHVGQEQDAKD